MTIDELVQAKEKKCPNRAGRRPLSNQARPHESFAVDIEAVRLEWFNTVLNSHRCFLQQVFEEPLDLESFGRRLNTYTTTKANIKQSMRDEWIHKSATEWRTLPFPVNSPSMYPILA